MQASPANQPGVVSGYSHPAQNKPPEDIQTADSFIMFGIKDKNFRSSDAFWHLYEEATHDWYRVWKPQGYDKPQLLNLDFAKTAQQKVLKLAEATKKDSRFRSHSDSLYSLLGKLYVILNEPVQAEKWLRVNIKSYTESINKGAKGESYLNDVRFDLASALFAQGRYPEARQELEKILDIISQPGSGGGPYLPLYANLAQVCYMLGDYGAAEGYLQEASVCFKRDITDNHSPYAYLRNLEIMLAVRNTRNAIEESMACRTLPKADLRNWTALLDR